MRGTQEFIDLQEYFERTICKAPGIYIGATPAKVRVKREVRLPGQPWPKYFYEHGKTEEAFRAFMHGYAYGKTIGREEST